MKSQIELTIAKVMNLMSNSCSALKMDIPRKRNTSVSERKKSQLKTQENIFSIREENSFE